MFKVSVEALLLIYAEGCGRCMREEVVRIREIPLQERRLCYPYCVLHIHSGIATVQRQDTGHTYVFVCFLLSLFVVK
jgi:hypothetical protein